MQKRVLSVILVLVASIFLTSLVSAAAPTVNITVPTANAMWFNTNDVAINYSVSGADIFACWWTNDSGVTNYTVTCGTNFSFTAVYGNNSITVYSNDSLGMTGFSVRDLMFDNIAPAIDLQPQSIANGANSTTRTVRINVTANDALSNVWLILNIFNSSGYNVIGGKNFNGASPRNVETIVPYYNEENLSDGNYTMNVTVTDAAGNANQTATISFLVDAAAPLYSSIVLGTASGSAYNLTKFYQFNITITETTTGVGSAVLIFNNTNYTMSLVAGKYTNSSVANLPAGTYNYSFWFNDTLGNYNSTSSSSYVVSKATGSVKVYINGSNLGVSIPMNTTSLLLNTSLLAGTGTISLYNRNVLIYAGDGATPFAGNLTNFTLAGLYNITAVYSGNNNYTSSNDTLWINVVAPTATVVNSTSVSVNSSQTDIAVSNLTLLENITAPSTSTQTVSVDFSALLSGGNVTLGSSHNVTLTRANASESNYTVIITAGTVISGGASWDGKIIMPIVNSSSFTSPAGGTTNLAIDLGSSIELNFSKAVKIILPGMSGKSAAWSRGSATLTNITTACNSGNATNLTAPTNINTSDARECYINSGTDLVIWTYHFTTFAAYTPGTATATTTTTSTTNGGGGSTEVNTTNLMASFTKSVFIGGVLSFNVNSVKHQVILLNTNVNAQTALILVKSSPQTLTMAVGEEKKFNLDSDNSTYELYVKLNSITINSASITIQAINESVAGKVVVEEKETVAETVEAVKEQVTNVVTGKASIWQYVTLAIIIVALIVLLLYLKKRRAQNLVARKIKHRGY